MQGLLLWVRVLTCVSLVLFSISCYNMVVRSEVEVGGREPDSQTGALTVVPESEDEDATVTTEDEAMPDFRTMDVFYPTKDWQEVKPGQAIPKGLHVRLNVQTGQREAKLMDGDNGLKYWTQGGKQGIVNTEKEYFTPEDLKKALKEFKVNKIDDEDTEIDNAILFCDIGGMKMVIQSLNHSSADMRSISSSLLATALQNNPKVKVYCIEAGVLHHFVRALSTEVDLNVRKRLLFALSAMVRNFPYAQTKFGELGGFSVLSKLFVSPGSVEDATSERTLSLVVDLMEEHESVTKKNKDHSAEELLKQYQEFPLHDHLLQNGFCEIVGNLLENIPPREYESTTEIMLKAAMKMKDQCAPQFKGHAAKFKSLQDHLLELYLQDTEFEFYRDLSEMANNLFDFLKEKDEL
uniref:Nucleotide exchange factor SIL1 n=1 Tax=Crassostrea virginica TaxID=6565 RepID=A0A8B8AB45_CRAVI|nr:nucleotide exchange factor SIL1-like isoform X2 [Crassostrea virginica]